ncbi:TonB-dependent receptor [Paucibacter sp. TC2R-5]|uniref:TonB-dependent receptor n=1 Tax=Paucibacter sp. TC2R-5 TaxID=2893555 RepID=UPI0021E456CD|nr:TonB-dependent receptor [Paucibacter sp. TC2R-5]MCV2361270.1 TonB-dependent receptor [Paucibacter sp. TC2R-5]
MSNKHFSIPSNTRRAQAGFRLAPIALAFVGLFGSASVFAQTAAAEAVSTGDAAKAADTAKAADAASGSDALALDGITVRSRVRIERLQDVPLSISVVQGTEIERLSAYGIEAVTRRAANVSWNLGNQRTSSIAIRGIGKVGQTEAQDPSVGVIVDGVAYAYNALTSSFDFVDIDTVEVTRGPQGTLLGKNNSVGTLIFNTRKPSFTSTADYKLEFRQDRGLFASAAAGGAVIDDLLAYRVAFSVNRGEGDIKNIYNPDVTYTNKDRVSGRLQFLLTPTQDFNARLSFDLQPRAGESTNGRSFSKPTPPTYLNGEPVATAVSKFERRWFKDNKAYSPELADNNIINDAARPLVTGSKGATADLNWNLGSHTLTSITAYKDYHFNAYNDENSPFDIARNSGGYWNDYSQVSQEFRITSATGGFVDYQAGLYLLSVKNDATYNKGFGNDAGANLASDAQYAALDADGNGRYLLQSSLAHLRGGLRDTGGVQAIQNKSAAIFGQANWNLSPAWTVTTGARVTREDRQNTVGSRIFENGSAPELNASSINGVKLGGFDSFWNNGKTDKWALNGNTVAAGTPGATLVAAGKYALTTDSRDAAAVATGQKQADFAAKKYFNAASWAALTDAQKKQLFYAQAIRKAAVGVLSNDVEATPYKATQPTLLLSPSYKVNPDVTTYASFQHGEKAGIAQVYNGKPYAVEAEKTDSFELGVKSALLGRSLILNAAVYQSRITNYQQLVRVIDDYATEQAVAADPKAIPVYAGITGNVPRVKLYGLELDGFYSGIRNTTLRFSGALNNVTYDKFPNAGFPVEEGNVAVPAGKDLSGRQLPGAPKYSFNVGGDYNLPVAGDKIVRGSVNLAYSSSYYSDNALSIYSVIPSSYVVDAGIGFGRRDKGFEVMLLAKNLLNDKTPQSQTWNSTSPAVPRSFAISFSGRI